ncbi:hypothetical protein ACJJJB_01750 [Microbulbifer sp. ANSA001]|uniref:hypothetical protein n=1 Tax=Microbulbifer sp. ANSA001 TaxID=3243358 RepID=UPI00404303FB
MKVSVSLDTSAFDRASADLQRQLPYASSVALNNVAFRIRGEERTAILNIHPKFLLCDIADESAAKVASESEFEVGVSEKSNTVPNSVRNIASMISDGRLCGHNSWYVNADPVAHDTIEVLYLDGQ